MTKTLFLFSLFFFITAPASGFCRSISSDCTYKGIPLHGRVEVVTIAPDIRIEYVTIAPGLP